MFCLPVQDFGKAGEALAEHVVGGQGISVGGGRGGPIQAKVPRGSRLHQIVEWLKGGEGDPLIVSPLYKLLASLLVTSQCFNVSALSMCHACG